MVAGGFRSLKVSTQQFFGCTSTTIHCTISAGKKGEALMLSSSPSGAKCCSSSIRGSLTQQAMEPGIVMKEFERSRSLSTRQFYQLLSPKRVLHFADTYITLSHSGSDVPLATKTQWKHIYDIVGTGNQD